MSDISSALGIRDFSMHFITYIDYSHPLPTRWLAIWQICVAKGQPLVYFLPRNSQNPLVLTLLGECFSKLDTNSLLAQKQAPHISIIPAHPTQLRLSIIHSHSELIKSLIYHHITFWAELSLSLIIPERAGRHHWPASVAAPDTPPAPPPSQTSPSCSRRSWAAQTWRTRSVVWPHPLCCGHYCHVTSTSWSTAAASVRRKQKKKEREGTQQNQWVFMKFNFHGFYHENPLPQN